MGEHRSFMCNHCYIMKTEEGFYKTKTNICKQCLNSKIKCDLCEGYYTMNNKNYHMNNYHSDKQVCKICKTNQYIIISSMCKNCYNTMRKLKINCPQCIKVFAKSSLTKHKKICGNSK